MGCKYFIDLNNVVNVGRINRYIVGCKLSERPIGRTATIELIDT